MAEIKDNIKNILTDIICMLSNDPAQMTVTITSMATSTLQASVICNHSDMKYVIGKNGNNVSAMRTILHAIGAKNGFKTYMTISD